jgi:hypothetical protein
MSMCPSEEEVIGGPAVAFPTKAGDARARRVVIGLDEHGRSACISDQLTNARLVEDAFTLNHIWQATSVPVEVSATSTLSEKFSILPPPEGYTYMVTTWAPDSSWDFAADYGKSMAAGGAEQTMADVDIPGLHATDTVDMGTVISGEIWAVFETGEVLLRAGDSWVMKGCNHTWRNRSSTPTVAVVLMVGATRSEPAGDEHGQAKG